MNNNYRLLRLARAFKPGGAGLDTSQITGCYYMFSNNQNIIKAPYFDTSNVTSMGYMFYNCPNLLEIPIYNTSKVTNMGYMFRDCKSLIKAPNLDTSKVQTFDYMYQGCTNLIEVPDIDASSASRMYQTFYNCKSLIKAPKIYNITQLSVVTQLYYGCSNLEEVPEIDLGGVRSCLRIVSSCPKLTTLGGFKNLGKGYGANVANYSEAVLELRNSPNLTHESLINVINNLYDLNLTYDVVNGGTLNTQGLYLGSTNLAKLTADEVAIATNKGWTVS